MRSKSNPLGLRIASHRDAFSRSRRATVYNDRINSHEEPSMTSQSLRHASSRTKHGEATEISRSERTQEVGYDHNDPTLKTGVGGLTVWKLREMARRKQFDELNDMFNNGLNMNALPVGLAAGAAHPMLEAGIQFVSLLLNYLTVDRTYLKVDTEQLFADSVDSLVSRSWRGKVFFSSNNRKISKGRNRMQEFLIFPRPAIVPMNQFDTMLLDSHPLAKGATSNLVILNYADPQTRPYLQEVLITNVPCYDVQVAVRGRYGPIFIGKTWLGKYDKRGEFTTAQPDKVVAWYFLDFNAGALIEQRDEHWDGSDEKFLNPLPHIDN